MTDKKVLFVKGYFRNKLLRKTITFIMLLLFSFNIFAEVVPDPASIGTRATKTASGIDQLDIAAPNKNGTSYNSLKELQVSEQGLILNNNKDIVANTKIAGYVARNRNLDNSIAANLIITEVTGKNRTNINGTVEVAGKRADLVMANRNGVYVNGGNFLNTDRVTLTTGSLEMKNGDLVAINVSQGQIGIGEKGLNALNLTELELLGKTIDVSGVIKASKETRLLVSAGGQTYEYKTKEVKSKGETYKGIAIDGKSVGSMYAGKIDIISNDKGAGVNTKGDLVSVDDIVITANGDITTAQVDSGKDLKYKTTQKVKMNGKTTVAKKVKVKARETEINAKVVTGYLEKALGKKSLDIESEKTNITAKIEAQGKIKINSNQIQNSGEIFATEKINIAGNKLNNNNGEIRSNQKIEINAKETSNVKGYILSDGLTKEDVKKEENKNQKDVEDDKNKEKGISITGDLDNTEGVIRGREVNLGNVIGNNKGKIDSLGALAFNGKIIVNKGGLITGNIQELNTDKLENDGGKLLSTGKISGRVKEISNKNGEILGTETVKLIGDKLDNFSGLIKSNGKIALDIKETSNIKGYILSDGLTKEDIKKEENKNQKDIEDDKNKEKGINITGDLDNTEGVIRGREVNLGNVIGNNKGKIDSLGALSFNGKIIVNKGGLITGNIQKLNIDKLINDGGKLVSTEKISGTVKEISNKNGEILGVQTVTLVGDKLNNLSGVIRSYGKVKLNEKDVSNVEGYILSDGITKEQAQNWKVEEKFKEENKDKENQKDVNGKREQSTGTLLNVGRLNNTKGIIASLSQTTVNVEKIANNHGKIVSRGAVELTTANEYEYRGLVEGDYATTLNAKKIIINSNIDRKNTLSLISKEKITLGQSIRARILSIATQADLRNAKDISATNLLSITAKNIENTGNIYSGGNTYLEAKNGDLINKDGGSIKADKQVYIEVKNGKVVNGTEKYLSGAYRREDGVLVDNRQIKEEKPSIIAGKTETIINAKDLINTSQMGKTGQGITYIKLTGNAVNASIGNNIAKIEGQKVSVEGDKGVTNTGAIISGTEITRVIAEKGKILNESSIVSGSTENIRNIGKIEGNGIVYLEGKEIENIAGNIGGAGGTILKSTEGNIEDKTITLVDNRKDGSWDIVNKTKTVSGVIGNGKDTILDSAKDLVLESSDIRAKDNIVLNAKNNLLMLSTVDTEYKFKTETTSKRRRFGGRKTTTKTWIEDNVYANPVELISGGYILINYRGKGKAADNKGVFAQGVNFNAKKGIIAKSDGNIYIQGVKDNLNSIYDSHTTKSFLGIKYKRTSDYVSDNSEKYKHSQLYGDAGVTLDSQGRLRVQGVDIQTIGPVYLKGVKGVEILSGNEISSRYEVHTSKSLKIGSDKSGLFKGLKIEQDKNRTEMDRIKSIGSIINSKGSTVTIKGDSIVSVGSKIGAAGDINLIGEHGVVIKDGENFAKIREENEKIRAGMFTSWSLKNLSAGIGVEGTYNKTNDGKTIVTPEKNVIVTNKNLNIISKSGNIFMQGDFGAKEDINVKAEKGKIYIKDSKSEVLTDSRSVNARMALALGINLSGFKDTLKSYKSQLKAIKEIPNLGRVISFTRDIAKGKSLLESLDGKEDTINAISTMYNGPSTGSASAGLDVTGNINVSKSISKYLQNITTTIRAGKDITFKSKEFETEGSFIRAENNLTIDASKILIQASADKYVTNSKNMGATFGVTLTGTNSVSGGLNYGQMNSKGTLYNNAQIQAGNKLIVKADNMTIRGGRLEGKYTDVDVKQNLLIESLQDSEEMKQVGTNVGYSLKKDKTQDGSLGLSFGGKDKKWVKEQSGIIGRESVKVKVGGKLSLIGSIIANVDDKGNDKGNLTLSYGKLEVKDLDSYDKQINVNGSVELNQRSKDNNKELVLKENKEKDKKDNDNSDNSNNNLKKSKNSDDNKGEDVEERDNKVDETYGIGIEGSDKHKITRATIGKGVINGKEEVVGVNRDIGKSEEITKDINVKKIEIEYKSERNSWGDFGKIMASDAGVIGNFLDNFSERKSGKPKSNYEEKFRNKVYESISNYEGKLQIASDFTSLLPTELYHGGILEQLVRRKDQVKLISIKVKMNEDGTPDIKLVRKKKLSEIEPDDEGKVYVFGNGIRETEEGAVRNAILKSMSPENLERYKSRKTVEIALIYNPTRGFVGDGLECATGKLFDGSWSSLKITTNVSKETATILATRDRNVTYIYNMYSQGNIVGLGAFNWLQDNGIKLGYKDKNKFLVGMFGSPIARNLIVGFEDNLSFTFRGSAINFRDFIGNDDKIFGIFGESTLINPENINRVKEHLWTDKLGNFFGTKAILRRETIGGLYLPEVLVNKNKDKDEYRYSMVVGNKEIEGIQQNYSKILNLNEILSKKGIEMVISDSHGTYTFNSPVIAENINNLLTDYRRAITPEEREKYKNEIISLYTKDQQNKVNLAMYGPPIFTDSPFLLKAVEDYKKDELRKEYGYGNYQDKNLPKNKEININPQPYTRKEAQPTLGIKEYLKGLREGVGL